MLGPSLLAAPIFSEDGKVYYYLPPGRWTNLLSGKVINGGGWQNEEHDYKSLPLMVRPNSIIPVGRESERPDYDYAEGISLHVFELDDGNSVTVSIPNSDQEYSVSRKGGRYTAVRKGGKKDWSLAIRGILGESSSKAAGLRKRKRASGFPRFQAGAAFR
jgi:alpha-D-xyloside xylohydrolase